MTISAETFMYIITACIIAGAVLGYFIAKREMKPKKNDRTTRFVYNGKDWMPEK